MRAVNVNQNRKAGGHKNQNNELEEAKMLNRAAG